LVCFSCYQFNAPPPGKTAHKGSILLEEWTPNILPFNAVELSHKEDKMSESPIKSSPVGKITTIFFNTGPKKKLFFLFGLIIL
jgi:hypothetical protein